MFFSGEGGHKRVVWMLWCVTPCLHCTELKCIECMQNAVWHSYQSPSMEMNVPTDSRIRVHSVVQRPAEPGSPSFLPLSAQTCIKLPHTINTKFTLFVFVFKQISLKRQSTFSQKKKIDPPAFSLFFMIYSKFFPPPVMEKGATQRDSLSRWKWEFDIVSYRQHLFAGDMLVHWYVQAISSSVWHWWPSCCCKDWQKFSDSQ